MFEHGFPPYWSTIKKLIWLVGTGIVDGVTEIWKTVTGTLIHITDALEAPMRKCEVTLEPIQDLHGQDAPYPAGGGKNKILISPDTLVRSNGSPAIEYGADNSFTIKADRVLAYDACFAVVVITEDMVGQTYTISADEFKQAYPRISKSLESGGTYSTPEDLTRGSQHTYTITQDDVGYTLLVRGYNDTGADLTWNKIQLEFGSSATSFAPYSNICPITGWTGCEVTRSGKNVLPLKFYNGLSYNASEGAQFTISEYTGDVTKSGDSYSISTFSWGGESMVSKPLKAGKYKVNIQISATSVRSTIYVLDKDSKVYYKANTTSAQTWGNVFDLTGLGDGYRIAVFLATSSDGTITFTAPQIELGEEFTGYEEYSGTTLSVTFPETVYGGKYDFVGGNGTEEIIKFTVNPSALALTGSGYIFSDAFRTTFGLTRNVDVLDRIVFCNMLAQKPYSQLTNSVPGYAIENGGYIYICWDGMTDLTGSTTQEIRSYFTSNPLEFAFKTTNPATFTGTPQPISTLKGENNVWSNSNGDTTIIYKAQAS